MNDLYTADFNFKSSLNRNVELIYAFKRIVDEL